MVYCELAVTHLLFQSPCGPDKAYRENLLGSAEKTATQGACCILCLRIGERVGVRHVLRVLCHFKMRSRGGVIINDKRILCSFPTMERRIQTFITRNQDGKTYKMLSKGMLPCQDAFRKHDKMYSCIRRQDLQDTFERHAPLSRRVQKTRQDVFVYNKKPRPTRRIRKARSHFKTRSEKQDKTYSCITRRQDIQDAFDRHAPLSRFVHKNKTRRIRA